MTLQKVVAIVLLVSMMFDAGLQANWRDMMTLVRNGGLLAGALIANFIVVPLAALGIVRLLHVNDSVATGVLLMAIAPGVPFVILAGGRGKGGSHELAVDLAVGLPLLSSLIIPFAADWIVPGSQRANVLPAQLIGLVSFQIVPLLLGVLMGAALPSIAPKILRLIKPITLVSLLALLASLVPLIMKSAAAVFGSVGIIAAISIVAVSLAAGWLLGRSNREHRATLAVGTALRNPGLAMAIATTAFATDSLVAAGVVTYFLVQMVVVSTFGATVLKAACRVSAIPASALPFNGGLFFRGLQRTRMPDAALLRLRMAAIFILPLLAWIPLFVLATIDGKMLPGSVGTPFLHDLSAHIRLLVALPLFILAARMGEARLLPTLEQFLARRLVPETSIPRFEAAVASAFRFGDSIIADLLIIAVIYSVDTVVVWRTNVVSDAATWYASSAAQGSHLTAAGICYAYFSLPIFQFVLLRWYYRLFIWARFLARVSRLHLNLVPTHPDRVGGLDFLIVGTQALAVFAMAHGALLAGWLSTRVVVGKASLPDFKGEIVAVVAFVLCLTLAPLTAFAGPLTRAKRRGVIEYGALASRYVNDFAKKWFVPEENYTEPLVGSADVQSLADMGGSYEIVHTMRSVPITLQMIVVFVAATLVPVAPLLLTMMPLSEILKKLGGISFLGMKGLSK